MAAPEKQPRVGRKRGIPPAPPVRTAFDVLAKGEDALVLALWQSLRNVQIWAQAADEERPALFRRTNDVVRARLAAAAAAAPVLGDPLAVLAGLQDAPAAATPARVALACHHVWEWAERRWLAAVAAHYAEAAAYAEPLNPTWAVVAGYMTRKLGDPAMWPRSAAWHIRARALAVRARDRLEVIRALTGYGALLKDMGRPDDALAVYEEAARRAVRGRKRRAAVVEHYMFSLCVDHGRWDEAVRHAARAFELYPRKDERLPYLAHDLAYLLVVRRHHRLALHLLDAAARRMDRPHEMGLMLGTTAQAAGGAGRAARYAAAERATLDLLAQTQEHAAAALASLAEGARSLGDWERAERHARESLLTARRRHDREQVRESVALLRAVARREPPPPAGSPPWDAPVAVLARRIAARLRRAGRRGVRR